MTDIFSVATSEYILSDPIMGQAVGGEYLGWTGLPGWAVQADYLGVGHIRWPGGIIAEDRLVEGEYAYDISTSNLVDNWPLSSGHPRSGIQEVFEYAATTDLSVSLIIPTARYVELMLIDESAAIQWIQDDVTAFTQRLQSGSWGEIPENLTLEIGAEYYSTDLWEALSTSYELAEVFGRVFAEIVGALASAEQTAAQELYSIAVQSGRFQSNPDSGETRDGEEADSQIFLNALLAKGVGEDVDALIWHRYVYSFAQIDDHLALDGAGTETTLSEHLNFWESQLGHSIKLISSWASPDVDSEGESASDPWFDYGPRSALNTIQMFSYLMANDVNIATIYGIDSPWKGAISSGEATPDDYTVLFNGEAYKLIAESVEGLSVLQGFEQNEIFIDEDNNPTPTDHINLNAYSDLSTTTTLFLSAWDLVSSQLTVSVELPESHESNFIELTHIAPSELTAEAQASYKVGYFDVSDGQVLIQNFQDFDFARVEFSKDLRASRYEKSTLLDVESGRAWTSWSASDDFVYLEHSGAKQIFDAMEGDDRIEGSSADEIIIGNEGNDVLRGSGGNDLLVGDGVTLEHLEAWLNEGTDFDTFL